MFVRMGRNRLVPLAVVAAVACLIVPLADAKFRMWVTVSPARPAAGNSASVIMRTDVAVPRRHGIRLYAVGPYRTGVGQAFFEVTLVRTRPAVLRGSVVFPYRGRWHLNVPPSAASGAGFDKWVRVRPRASG
jgi:hypothetical protein